MNPSIENPAFNPWILVERAATVAREKVTETFLSLSGRLINTEDLVLHSAVVLGVIALAGCFLLLTNNRQQQHD